MSMQAGTDDDASSRATFSVVAGSPTAEELAALTAVVVALQGIPPTTGDPAPGRSWVRRALLSLGPRPGPASWRRSGR